MKGDTIFLIIMIIGVLVILSTGIVRATVMQTTTFCTENTGNPFCSAEGLSYEQAFSMENAHITLIETCDNT